MIPTFAVVGHPNKGKSSIVATLAEDSGLAIGPVPGTTAKSKRYTFQLNGNPQYVLVDTPGFQRVRAVLEWLHAHATSAQERPKAVADFVAAHKNDDRFIDECELLEPIINGAGILYVVDGAKPYGPEYELEMQILQWTGQPRMALINLIGDGDYVEQWRQGLGQYFSIVRIFDAVHADFQKRLSLLRGFAELEESWREGVEQAISALEQERLRRRKHAATEIAESLRQCLQFSEQASTNEDTDEEKLKNKLHTNLLTQIDSRERRTRATIQSLYRHDTVKHQSVTAQLLNEDLFAKTGWELFGLSHTQLLISGAVSGAVAGGGIDVLVGGASLLLGTVIGAVLGGASVWFGADQIASVKVLGLPLGGKIMQVGPVKSASFPWVLLGRAWVHQQLIAERNHARREVLSQSIIEEQHLMDSLPQGLRRSLARIFKGIINENHSAADQDELADLIDQVLSNKEE